ncbi:MAG: hypothetical protein ACI4J7_05925 [Ruminiclostridium sp.]
MTDNEIIKALECCNGDLDCCKKCPAKENNVECGDVLKNNALKLINRQKAEIDELKKKNLINKGRYYIQGGNEAIKEFAKRLKESKKQYEGTLAGYTFTIPELDNLVKEMTEGEK